MRSRKGMLYDGHAPGHARRRIGAAAAALVLLAVAAGIYLLWGRARVTGRTPAERIESVRRIAAGLPGGAAKALVEAMSDDSELVRAEAVRALAQVGIAGHEQAVLAATRDAAPAVRSAGALALGLWRDTAAVQRMADLASEDDDARVRAAAVQGLRQSDSPQATVALVRLMETDGAPDVQMAALEALKGRYRLGLLPVRPGDRAVWPVAVERVKARREIQDAFARAGVKLVRHPERLPLMVDEEGRPRLP